MVDKESKGSALTACCYPVSPPRAEVLPLADHISHFQGQNVHGCSAGWHLPEEGNGGRESRRTCLPTMARAVGGPRDSKGPLHSGENWETSEDPGQLLWNSPFSSIRGLQFSMGGRRPCFAKDTYQEEEGLLTNKVQFTSGHRSAEQAGHLNV